jgi:hypothetical protein
VRSIKQKFESGNPQQTQILGKKHSKGGCGAAALVGMLVLPLNRVLKFK